MSNLAKCVDRSTNDSDNSSSDDELHVVTTSRNAFQTYRPGVSKRRHGDDDSGPEEEKRSKKDKTSSEDPSRRRSGYNDGDHIPSGRPWQRDRLQEIDNDVEIIESPVDANPSGSGIHDSSSSSESDEEVFSLSQVPQRIFTRFHTSGTSVRIHVDAFRHRPTMSDVHFDMWLRQHLNLEQRRARQTVHSRIVSRTHESIGSLQPLNSILRRVLNFIPEYEDDEGASTDLIQNSTVLYTYEVNPQLNNNQNICVVCITNFEIGQTVRQLPCLHIFHQNCVDRWLVNKKCCPICRNNIDEHNCS